MVESTRNAIKKKEVFIRLQEKLYKKKSLLGLMKCFATITSADILYSVQNRHHSSKVLLLYLPLMCLYVFINVDE